ncbi:MAG: hypothetical protein ABWZ68_13050, partial [Acidimicrobiales bacterium]
LDAAFGGDLADVDEVHREKLETLNGIHSNAAGFRRWLDQRADQRHGHCHGSGSAHPAPTNASIQTDDPPA